MFGFLVLLRSPEPLRLTHCYMYVCLSVVVSWVMSNVYKLLPLNIFRSAFPPKLGTWPIWTKFSLYQWNVLKKGNLNCEISCQFLAARSPCLSSLNHIWWIHNNLKQFLLNKHYWTRLSSGQTGYTIIIMISRKSPPKIPWPRGQGQGFWC